MPEDAENSEAPKKAPAKKKTPPAKTLNIGEPVGTVVDGAPSSIHRAVILPD